MKNKSVICGQIAAFGKKLVEGEEHDFYQVRVLDDRETTVFDVQMQAIEKMYTNVELQDWVIEIAAKYGIYVGDIRIYTIRRNKLSYFPINNNILVRLLWNG